MIINSILIILCAIPLVFFAIRVAKFIVKDFKKYVIDFFIDMTLSKDEQNKIDDEIKSLYKESSLNELLKNNKNEDDEDNNDIDTVELLLQIKDFYKDEATAFGRDYTEFLQKADLLFRMFTIPIPFYIGIMAYLLNGKLIKSPTELATLVLAILVYLYFLIRIIWVHSLKNGFTKIPVEFPFKINNISIENYLKNYIINSALHLKIQRENLLRLKTKIQGIHAQYIASSMFLILVIVVVYLK